MLVVYFGGVRLRYCCLGVYINFLDETNVLVLEFMFIFMSVRTNINYRVYFTGSFKGSG